MMNFAAGLPLYFAAGFAIISGIKKLQYYTTSIVLVAPSSTLPLNTLAMIFYNNLFAVFVLLDWRPEIVLNGTLIKDTDITLSVGTCFILRCSGAGNVSLKTSPRRHRRAKSYIKVKEATVSHTGRYGCYSDEHPQLHSEVYIYITGMLSSTP